MTKQEPGDDLWDEFVRVYEKQQAPHEPSAAERAAAASRRPRWWRLYWGSLVLAGCLVLAVGGAYRYAPWYAAGAPVVTADSAQPTATATAEATATATATAGRALVAVTPAQAFPATVPGYTRVATATADSCTATDSVGSTLAGMIKQGSGCLGLDFGLYKDASGNEYDLAVFTMKDPVDAVAIVTSLSMDPTDDQVAVQVPPKGSGLRALPADSGLVQAFHSYGHLVVVGMAQWSDGHSGDFQQLEDKLSPLLGAVTKHAETHDPT